MDPLATKLCELGETEQVADAYVKLHHATTGDEYYITDAKYAELLVWYCAQIFMGHPMTLCAMSFASHNSSTWRPRLLIVWCRWPVM
jgi:hypothetical protein